jgi:hypothetical protein
MNRNITCAGCGDRTQYKVGSADEDLFFRVGPSDVGQRSYKKLNSTQGKMFFCNPMCWLDARLDSRPPPLSLFEPWYAKQGARFTKEDWSAVRRRLGYAVQAAPATQQEDL